MSLANEPAPTAPTFQELIDKAKAALTDMSNHVNQMLGLPEQANSEQILNTMKDETNKLTEKVRAFVETLQKEVSRPMSYDNITAVRQKTTGYKQFVCMNT